MLFVVFDYITVLLRYAMCTWKGEKLYLCVDFSTRLEDFKK